MAALDELLSTGLIEKDVNNDVLWTWSYPSVTEEQRNLILRKCGLDAEAGSGRAALFLYGHYHNSWYYLSNTEVFDSDNLSKVKQFVVVLWTKDFNPEKYEVLCRILSKTYCKTGNPAAMLQLYLSVLTAGSCSTEENGTFFVKDFDQRNAFASASIKDVIRIFKLETILIYTAIILKKRIVVYHHCLASLLRFLRALPAFAWHRQNWQILYPFVDLVPEELLDLTSSSTYIAGFLDAAVESRTDLFDLFINLAATEIAISPHSKDSFSMSKTHKEIALFMVHCAEDKELNDQDVIKEIASKTKEVLNNLKSCASSDESGNAYITFEALKSKKFGSALENFLFNLAVAENLVKI